jgi:hypothetical protein
MRLNVEALLLKPTMYQFACLPLKEQSKRDGQILSRQLKIFNDHQVGFLSAFLLSHQAKEARQFWTVQE